MARPLDAANEFRDIAAAMLRRRLTGIYLHGSLASDDFHPATSDIDLAIFTAGMDSEALRIAAGEIQHQLASRHPLWAKRTEAIYIVGSLLDLCDSARRSLTVAVGANVFDVRDSGPGWTITWYCVRNASKTLHGPRPDRHIRYISRSELCEAARAKIIAWKDLIRRVHDPSVQAYAVLIVCRALHTMATNASATKTHAANWALVQYPRWRGLIHNCMQFRDLGLGKSALNRTALNEFVAEAADIAKLMPAGAT